MPASTGTVVHCRWWSPAASATTGRCCRPCWKKSTFPAPGPGRARTRPDVVLADRGYATGVIRSHLRERGIVTVIPEKRDSIAARKRKGSKGGRPPAFDEEAYKGRNVVERAFSLAKQWRGLATRYDKLAVVYRGAVVLCAVITWLKALGDTP